MLSYVYRFNCNHLVGERRVISGEEYTQLCSMAVASLELLQKHKFPHIVYRFSPAMESMIRTPLISTEMSVTDEARFIAERYAINDFTSLSDGLESLIREKIKVTAVVGIAFSMDATKHFCVSLYVW